jgi:two-component system chemotaxis response regulator CheB
VASVVKVLVVDDPPTVRDALKDILDADPAIAVIGVAGDPYEAATLIAQEVPDVIVLGVEMPRMDGLTFLRKLMSQCPVPVVMCPLVDEGGAEVSMAALEAGAADIILIPKSGVMEFLLEAGARICEAVKSAGRPRPRPAPPEAPAPSSDARSSDKARLVAGKLSADVILPPPQPKRGSAVAASTEVVVCIGASTGGTEALHALLQSFPADAPGMVVVQHMPETFTGPFARRLDSLCALSVREAQDGDDVCRGRVLIAPGNRHILLKRNGARYTVELRDGPLVARHRPSVDVMFRSAAHYAGTNAIGVLMTGMGDDGARGLLEMFEAGAHTIAQDKATCVVFGMPNEAIKRGAVRKVLPLGAICDEVLRAAIARD